MTGFDAPLRPFAELDPHRPLLALDFDGPLNRFVGGASGHGPKTMTVVDPRDNSETVIDFYPDRIAELDRIVRAHGVNIGWLSSWGETVDTAIEQAFDGLLAGGFILAHPPRKGPDGSRPRDWKFYGLRSHLQTFPTPWAWVDDEEIANALQYDPRRLTGLTALAPGLQVHVDEATTITEKQLVELDAFFAQHAG